MKLVVFDCDGTLVDSQHLIVSAMSHAFERAGRVPLPREQVLSIVGLSLPYAIETLVPDATRAEVEHLTQGYREGFSQLRQQPDAVEPLYEGMAEIISWLDSHDDVALGVATGKSRRGVDRIVDMYNFHGRFQAISTADEHPSKPHPSMIDYAVAAVDAEPTQTIMVGDTTFDIEMAHAAGVQAVGVTWGYHPQSALERAAPRDLVTTRRDLARRLKDRLNLTEPPL